MLVIAVVAIGYINRTKRSKTPVLSESPSLGKMDTKAFDEVIAVRKISVPSKPHQAEPSTTASSPSVATNTPTKTTHQAPVMFFIQAKEKRLLAGYELLQTILATGLRFGEGNLFHRHQQNNGQGLVLCSLAAATKSGVFDLQSIGSFSVRGLCLFMQHANDPAIDTARFEMMLQVGKQLSEELDADLLDDQQQPLTSARLQAYYHTLGLDLPSHGVERA
tara:strand:+ start:86 stop:745 length:660 start_codon:yes stop_codon:yes gene_type:complete